MLCLNIILSMHEHYADVGWKKELLPANSDHTCCKYITIKTTLMLYLPGLKKAE